MPLTLTHIYGPSLPTTPLETFPFAAQMPSVMATIHGGGPGCRGPATVGAYDDYFDEDNELDWTAVAVTGSVTWELQGRDTVFAPSREGFHAVFQDQTAEDFPVYVKLLVQRSMTGIMFSWQSGC